MSHLFILKFHNKIANIVGCISNIILELITSQI